MDEHNRRRSILPVVIVALLLLFGVCIFSAMSLSVSGTATLPSGVVATIDGPFDASENKGLTSIGASGRKFDFTRSAITVDGTTVANLDPSVVRVAIDARGRDPELVVNGQRVLLPPR